MLKIKGMLNYNMVKDDNVLGIDDPDNTFQEVYVETDAVVQVPMAKIEQFHDEDETDTLEAEYIHEIEEHVTEEEDNSRDTELHHQNANLIHCISHTGDETSYEFQMADESDSNVQISPKPISRVKKRQRFDSQSHTANSAFSFEEIEPTTESRKGAKLLADGTAKINASNVQYFRERLEHCVAKIFDNVKCEPGKVANGSLYRVRLLFSSNPIKLKGLFECLMCGDKTIQVCYKHRDGKFKQWINSNVLRHVELSHKDVYFCPDKRAKRDNIK